MNAILTLAWKDLRLLFRDKVGVFFTLGFPLLMAVLFGYVFAGAGGGGREPVGVALVDLDGTPASAELAKSLAECKDLRVTTLPSADAGREAVRRRRQTAVIFIQPGFGAAAARPFWGAPGKVTLGVDPSRFAEAGLIQGIVMERAFRGFQKLMADPDALGQTLRTGIAAAGDDPSTQPAFLAPMLAAMDAFLSTIPRDTNGDGDGGNPLAGWQPVVVESESIAAVRRGPPNSFAVSFPQGMIWGILGCAAGFGISLVTERTGGTMTRLRLAPLARGHILGGKALACFLSTCLVAALLMVLARTVFGVVPTSTSMLVLGVVCAALGFVGVMMLLSVIGRTEAAAGGIGWAILTVMAMFGGGMVPTFVMPGWMQSASMFSPVRWAMEAVEGGLWRGYSPAEMALPCGLLLTIGVVGFATGAVLMGRMERRG
jgi:ABC-2 type transport system permease protein